MTKKMVYYLGDMGMPRILTKAGLQQSLKNNKPYVHGHLPASKNNMDLTAHHKLKVIFIYRDPRDQVVSLKYHNQGNAPPFGHRGRDLDKMIPRVTSFFSEFLQWQNHPCVYTTKFESLVGLKGGGTDEAQQQEILNIARHIGIKLQQKDVEEIANNIFGDMWTFRKGKIGAWREEFTPEQRLLFKEKNQKLLENLFRSLTQAYESLTT